MNINKIIYLYFLENYNILNLFLLIISALELRRNNDLYTFAFFISSIVIKRLFKSLNSYFLPYKKFIFLLITTAFIFWFNLKFTISELNIYYEKYQELIIEYTNVDIIKFLENICFSSISLSGKSVRKTMNEVYILNYKFFEEEIIKKILKYFIKIKLGLGIRIFIDDN